MRVAADEKLMAIECLEMMEDEEEDSFGSIEGESVDSPE